MTPVSAANLESFYVLHSINNHIEFKFDTSITVTYSMKKSIHSTAAER